MPLRFWGGQGGARSGDTAQRTDGNISHSTAVNINTPDDDNNNNHDDDKRAIILVQLNNIKDTMAELHKEVASVHERMSSDGKLLNGKMEQLENMIKELEEQTIKEEDLENERRDLNASTEEGVVSVCGGVVMPSTSGKHEKKIVGNIAVENVKQQKKGRRRNNNKGGNKNGGSITVNQDDSA